jgi:hypothetical protein
MRLRWGDQPRGSVEGISGRNRLRGRTRRWSLGWGGEGKSVKKNYKRETDREYKEKNIFMRSNESSQKKIEVYFLVVGYRTNTQQLNY